ncbi:MAG: hypothetical protein KBT32_11130 [Bacteroidales bacterium]|nr:hypothetical protein [Candidatus Physcocola equi]
MVKEFSFKIATAALILSTGTVSAQHLESASSDIEQKERKPILENVKPSLPKVSGLIQTRYFYDSQDAKPNSFDIRRVRLSVGGDFGKFVDYKVQAEYESSVEILDAYVNFKPAKAFNIQVGQFKVAYSQEGLEGPASMYTIERPAAVNKLHGYSDISGLSANARDVGVRFWGKVGNKSDYDVFTYKVGVYNGNGINIKDNDEYKNVGVLLTYNPIKQLQIEAGQYLGHYTSKAVTADELAAGASVNDNAIKRNRTAAGFTLNTRDFFFRSEYLYGRTDNVEQQGAFATAAYTIARHYQPVLGYSFYQKDKDVNEDLQHDITVGFNWLINKYLRLQTNYILTDYSKSDKEKAHLVEAQLSVKF